MILTISQEPTGQEEKKEKEVNAEIDSDGNALKNGLDHVSQAAKLAQQLLYTESSSTMSDIKNGRGFSSLEIKASYKQSQVKSYNKEKLLAYELSDKSPIYDLISDENIKKQIRNAIETFVFEESSIVNEYSLTFSNGVGTAYMIRIRTLTDPITGDFHYGRIIFSSPHFELAPDYVIVTETEKGFFSSSTSQYIRYIPRGITQADARQLLGFFADAAHAANIAMLPMLEGNNNPLERLG